MSSPKIAGFGRGKHSLQGPPKFEGVHFLGSILAFFVKLNATVIFAKLNATHFPFPVAFGLKIEALMKWAFVCWKLLAIGDEYWYNKLIL